MARKTTSPVPVTDRRTELLPLKREALKQAIEQRGQSYKWWILRHKVLRLIVSYGIICGLIAVLVFLWQRYILSYDWLAIDNIVFTSNGVFNVEQTLHVMQIQSQQDLQSTPAQTLQQRLAANPAIRKARVERHITPQSALKIDIDARIPIAWLSCKELGYHPHDTKYGMLIDREGVLFPCIEHVHAPYLQDRAALPAIAMSPPLNGQFITGSAIKELQAPLQLLARLEQANPLGVPHVQHIESPNAWSLVVRFDTGCHATFSPYNQERQIEKFRHALNHARNTNRKINFINLIPEHNIPVVFDTEQEPPLAEPVLE